MTTEEFIDQAAIAAMAAIMQSEALYEQCKNADLPMCTIHDIVADKATKFAYSLAEAMGKKLLEK